MRRERRQRQGAGSRHGRVRRAGQTGHGQRKRQEAERTERQQVRQRWCLSRKSDGDAGCREAISDLRVCLDVVVPTVRALTAFSRSPALTIAYDVRPDQGERTVVLARRNRGPGAEIPARLKSAVELGDAAEMGPPASPPRARVRICFLHGHSKSSIGLMASRCAPAGTKPGLRRDPHAVLARTAPPWQCPHGRHTVSQLQRPAPFTLRPRRSPGGRGSRPGPMSWRWPPSTSRTSIRPTSHQSGR